MTDPTRTEDRQLVRALVDLIKTSSREAVSNGNDPHFGTARALIRAGLIDLDALAELTCSAPRPTS